MSKERLEEIKERLEEIKEQLEKPNSYDDNPNGYWYHNINWLIKQAERVQEMEQEIEGRKKFESGRVQQVNNLIEQNQRYRGAIDKAIDDLENECLWDALVKLKALEGEE